jgi:hypothetical protein
VVLSRMQGRLFVVRQRVHGFVTAATVLAPFRSRVFELARGHVRRPKRSGWLAQRSLVHAQRGHPA